ncbi:ParB/RepB/Spo0J family partition protein [Puerhibacterium puerhi]|uniref:ParB/RepB/Spo0J family partition protein n=1 Tax=Puerhibacterium puerhi TaxID=2692623 RepID=UPI001357818E|nr:ParB N-terminal domain-containing protein [Puerhibacterium puerhi]
MNAATPHVAAPTRVDPRALVLAENVRQTVVLDTAFKRDIAQRGVRQPIEVKYDALGQLQVVTGQRRTLAALEAGLPEVPVVLVEDIADEADRIVEQLAENHHRAGITTADDAAAVKQLSLFGLSPAQIAKRTARPKEEVQAALALADASEETRAVVAEREVDLVTAAKIAAFDGDQDTVERLTDVALTRPEVIDHELERARRDKAERDAVAARVAELRAQGVTVVDDVTDYPNRSALDLLTDTPNASGTAPAIDPTAHQLKCPGHFVVVHSMGGLHEPVLSETAYCGDWKTHGHFNRYARNTATATSGPKPDDKAAERRRVIANNKAADAAIVVRRTFIRDLLQRATPPTDAVTYAARMLAEHRTQAGMQATDALHDLMPDGVNVAPQGTKNAHRYLLALAAAIGESNLHREFWRSRAYSYGGYTPAGVLHLQQLQAWGYTLADVEQTWLDDYLSREGRK